MENLLSCDLLDPTFPEPESVENTSTTAINVENELVNPSNANKNISQFNSNAALLCNQTGTSTTVQIGSSSKAMDEKSDTIFGNQQYTVPDSIDKTPILQPLKVSETPLNTSTGFPTSNEKNQIYESCTENNKDRMQNHATISASKQTALNVGAASLTCNGTGWNLDKLNHNQLGEKYTSSQMLWKLHNFQTFLGKISEKNVTYCLDTSGSMYKCLQTVKDHVTEALFQQANEDRESYFNLVEFSSQVTQWSDKQVKCSSQTVAVAAEWINKLEATTGTNMLDALLSAFSDIKCDGVCLITDGQPDQHPSEIIDNVAYIAQNRPVHCYYIQIGEPDNASIEFLQELAMETYGSFHIIHITQSGSVERIVPVYSAATSAERIVRTTDGNVYPSAEKVCSVSTTLDHPPDLYLETPNIVVQEVDPWYPFLPYPYYARWPHPFYKYYHYKYALPHYNAWSKWRPARAWSKFTQSLSNAAQAPLPAPGPGSTLIGTKVLARRNADGYFYIGSVKSQILYNKFLVEFGACKHGKYKDTCYQETYVYDMVSHADALRHSILPGDKVLAPWEPEGERYGPGVVLEGQEKRMAQGGIEDLRVVVSFHNGSTASVSINTAVWLPLQLYERIKFELQLPTAVREEFSDQDQYPDINKPGYPSSGTKGDPEEFTKHDPTSVMRAEPMFMDRGIYDNPYYVPAYPVYYKYQPRPSAVCSDEINALVPGTDLTKEQLNEKVMSQLMQYKMSLEDSREREDEKQKLLQRREKKRENVLKKSVTFSERQSDEFSDIEAELYSGDLEMKDSGHGSGNELELENLDDDEGKERRNNGVGTPSKMLYRLRRSRSPIKPPWRYWSNDPAPELLEPMHYGPYRVGPYDASVSAAPLELRNKRVNKDDVQWNSTLYQYVDPYAKHNYEATGTVKDSMGYIPRPPGPKPEKQGPGIAMSDMLGEHQRERDRVKIGRLEYRRQQHLARDQDIVQDRQEKAAMKQMMHDQHKQNILTQLEHDKQRHLDEMERVQRARNAKKQINTQIRIRIEANQEHENKREDQRQKALQKKRARREEVLQQKQRELEDVRLKRQVLKEERDQSRRQAVSEKINAQEAMVAAKEAQAREAKLKRLEHFQKKEEINQQLKGLEKQVRGGSSVFVSTVTP